MTLQEQQDRLETTLARLPSRQDRVAWLIEEARRRPMMDIAQRIDAHRVEGCLARLWLVAELQHGRCVYQSESDSLIVKAVAGLLCEFYSGHTPSEILAHPPKFLEKLGLASLLAGSRRNGLARVWETIRAFAADAADAAQRGNIHR